MAAGFDFPSEVHQGVPWLAVILALPGVSINTIWCSADHNQPFMTGTKFVANPLPGAAAPYDRLYKTGDRAVSAHAIALQQIDTMRLP